MRTINTFIQTYTGRKFYPTDPRPEDICIEDIAHALANNCRYTGHTVFFYSIAQHSVLCSKLTSGDKKWALMHDAAEAYIADIATPLKRQLPEYQEVEAAVEKAVAKKFGLTYPMPEDVKVIDRQLLKAEMEQLLPKLDVDLPVLKGVESVDVHICRMSPEQAETAFLYLFKQLWK